MATARPVRRTVGIVAATVGVLVLAVAVWLLTRSDPAEVSIDAAVADVTDETDAAQGADATAVSADGTWGVDTSVGTFDVTAATGSFVGFRVDEELANVGATTAVGRTPEVDGSVTIDGSTLTAAEVTADLTAIVSDRPRRDDRIQDALATGEFPTATFTLSESVDLGADPTAGEAVSVTAPGELTVHGVTQAVEVPLEAALVDDLVVVTGSLEIDLADYGVAAPTAPIVLSVSDTATVELQLYLAKQA